MPQPYDYSLNLPDPTQVFVQNLQLGQMLQKRAREQALQQRRGEVYAGLGPNSTYQDYMAAIKQIPEDRETLLATMKAMGDAKKGALFDAGGKAWSLLQADRDGNIDPTTAIAKLEESAAAFENSGDAETAKQLRDSAQAVKLDPVSGRNILGTMLAMADPDRFKTVADVGENKYARDIQSLSEIVGPDVARKLVLGREAAKGVVTATGPAGTQFIRAEDVFQLPAAEQPAAVAAAVAGSGEAAPNDPQNSLDIPQYNEIVRALGEGGAAAMVKRNDIPVRVKTPAEARKLPSGTKIIMPDGRRGVVP